MVLLFLSFARFCWLGLVGALLAVGFQVFLLLLVSGFFGLDCVAPFMEPVIFVDVFDIGFVVVVAFGGVWV
jgi:hypothetical protein